MTCRLALLLLVALLALQASPAPARTKAADYLIAEQIAAACDGAAGRMDPSGVIERDITGDGKLDLILNHRGIACDREGEGIRQSGFCGAQLCSVLIYVRRGALLKLEEEILSGGLALGAGSRPEIHLFGQGGKPLTLRWNGNGFR
ncbi:hypothetical protein [Afifella sp. IM 167]|uniref:hypothetical protein n=1 Tax=Afifella sp. IM 167 TaxID=2033586 RepID=UPI001CCF4CB6|nr:hypothetical protein [Afifella sp. IM 167]MBZ8133336.1 hypothetical protein [Afifella sp. IM 167]